VDFEGYIVKPANCQTQGLREYKRVRVIQIPDGGAG
jgi:hypothetical protein